MALTTCTACYGQVSSDAKTCPHCGKPLDTADRIARAIPGVLTGLVILYFISLCTGPAQPPIPSKTATPELTPEQIAACRADIKCTGERKSTAAALACRPVMEAQAQYSVKWPDGLPIWFYSEWRDVEKTAIVYLGDSLKLQNQFGAWENHIYSCTYDPDNDRVIEVFLAAGRI